MNADTAGGTARDAVGPTLQQLADHADRQYEQLVSQLDRLRAAVRLGDDDAVGAAFGRASQLLRSIVATGNDARIQVTTGDLREVVRRSRIDQVVFNAWGIANAIEAATPGTETL